MLARVFDEENDVVIRLDPPETKRSKIVEKDSSRSHRNSRSVPVGWTKLIQSILRSYILPISRQMYLQAVSRYWMLISEMKD